MPFVHRPGQPDIHYALDDFTDPWRNAPYLFLQHGFGRSGRFWYSWVPYLARWFKIVRPDVRGLGQSSAGFDLEREFTLENCISDLVAIIDHLGAESVHYCGESMGGILGMVLAGTHASQIRTLTLVSTPVHLNENTRNTYALGHGSESEAQKAIGMKAWVAATNRTTRFPPDADPQLLEWYEQEFARNDPEVQRAMSRVMHAASVLPYLARIEAPVLGLYPSAGPITTEEQQAMLRTHIRRLTLIHLRSEFHKIQLMFPRTCATHLLHFAAAHDGFACHEA
ncbi:MAG: alpha/beta fold hydrolase [Betaproteobacteria bacterium]|nr:alpha/beta fold hydrolase [Betaproteobacteria bacterium]